eukprot:gene8064-16540_t
MIRRAIFVIAFMVCGKCWDNLDFTYKNTLVFPTDQLMISALVYVPFTDSIPGMHQFHIQKEEYSFQFSAEYYVYKLKMDRNLTYINSHCMTTLTLDFSPMAFSSCIKYSTDLNNHIYDQVEYLLNITVSIDHDMSSGNEKHIESLPLICSISNFTNNVSSLVVMYMSSESDYSSKRRLSSNMLHKPRSSTGENEGKRRLSSNMLHKPRSSTGENEGSVLVRPKKHFKNASATSTSFGNWQEHLVADEDHSLNTMISLSNVSVVGSMTTSPSRLAAINGSMGLCIRTLLSFPAIDVLYLNIPWAYGLRTRSANVTIPEPLKALMDSSKGRLRVKRCRDYGPSTKLLPLLRTSDQEIPLDAMIITFDDDRIYTSEAVQALIRAGKEHPDSAITIAAWGVHIFSAGGTRGKVNGPVFKTSIPRGEEGQQYRRAGPVDLVLGFFGVLYRKRFFVNQSELFDYDRHEAFRRHCAWVDDVWFSGHLERLHIPRFVIGDVPNTRADITELSNVQALSLDHGVSVKQNHDNVLCAEAMAQEFGVWGGGRSHRGTGKRTGRIS